MIRTVLSDIGGVVLHLDWQAAAAHWEAELGMRAVLFDETQRTIEAVRRLLGDG
jgi:hypothetical protein